MALFPRTRTAVSRFFIVISAPWLTSEPITAPSDCSTCEISLYMPIYESLSSSEISFFFSSFQRNSLNFSSFSSGFSDFIRLAVSLMSLMLISSGDMPLFIISIVTAGVISLNALCTCSSTDFICFILSSVMSVLLYASIRTALRLLSDVSIWSSLSISSTFWNAFDILSPISARGDVIRVSYPEAAASNDCFIALPAVYSSYTVSSADSRVSTYAGCCFIWLKISQTLLYIRTLSSDASTLLSPNSAP